MPSKSVVVGSSVGLHARPAALIAEAAGELGVEVTINGVDASSALMLMTLGAACGDTVEVASDDEAAWPPSPRSSSRTSTPDVRLDRVGSTRPGLAPGPGRTSASGPVAEDTRRAPSGSPIGGSSPASGGRPAAR